MMKLTPVAEEVVKTYQQLVEQKRIVPFALFAPDCPNWIALKFSGHVHALEFTLIDNEVRKPKEKMAQNVEAKIRSQLDALLSDLEPAIRRFLVLTEDELSPIQK